MKHLVQFFWVVMFWGFITVKVWGVSFATWSWWWVLLAIVPWLALSVKHFGL